MRFFAAQHRVFIYHVSKSNTVSGGRSCVVCVCVCVCGGGGGGGGGELGLFCAFRNKNTGTSFYITQVSLHSLGRL